MLVLLPDQEPTLLVPTLERPDAEAAVGAPASRSWTGPTARTRSRRAAALRPYRRDDGDLGLGVGHASARAAGRRCPDRRTGR